MSAETSKQDRHRPGMPPLPRPGRAIELPFVCRRPA